MQTKTTGCGCFQPNGRLVSPEVLFDGTDTTNSSYGDVTLSRCQNWSTVWLRFFIEYESFGRSGRWYRAPVPAELVSDVTAENAIQMLNTLEPRFAGGSHFDSTGFETKALVDLRP
ncbi:hypothetical protein QCE62_00470 [Caballeronia sp. LZ033]|uniref:hypothetical protein n=1 Tax=Caballeronia sp. LZ033 TaxID=3038566 RepID=UPI002859E498|nr:hypothetical protein [Caballeronia sp. LZ033]MDR5812060.1 hypothetical protein [Caballeronia sp. LZ033]